MSSHLQRLEEPVFVRKISGSLATGVLLSLPTQAAADGPFTMTRDGDVPVGDHQNFKIASVFGNFLLKDLHLIEKFERFNRERIPERVIHANGTGAHGEFRFNQDFPAHTKASPFTPRENALAFPRFYRVIHPKGSRKALSEPRDFATVFYAHEGTWDLVANRSPPVRSRRLILQHQSTFKKG